MFWRYLESSQLSLNTMYRCREPFCAKLIRQDKWPAHCKKEHSFQWRRPGVAFGGGDGKFVRGPRFLNNVSSGRNFHFHAENFWWPFFSHRPGFPDFTFLYCIKCCIRPFLHKKNHYFKNEFLDKTIFITLYVLSRASDNTTSLNIGRDQCMGRPHLKFFLGDRPPSLP